MNKEISTWKRKWNKACAWEIYEWITGLIFKKKNNHNIFGIVLYCCGARGACVLILRWCSCGRALSHHHHLHQLLLLLLLLLRVFSSAPPSVPRAPPAARPPARAPPPRCPVCRSTWVCSRVCCCSCSRWCSPRCTGWSTPWRRCPATLLALTPRLTRKRKRRRKPRRHETRARTPRSRATVWFDPHVKDGEKTCVYLYRVIGPSYTTAVFLYYLEWMCWNDFLNKFLYLYFVMVIRLSLYSLFTFI